MGVEGCETGDGHREEGVLGADKVRRRWDARHVDGDGDGWSHNAN